MTDFALYNEGSWKDGQMPSISGATYVVHYDTTSRAYHIQKDDYDDFIEWVARKWEIDRAPRNEDEEASEYLDRIGVSIREL